MSNVNQVYHCKTAVIILNYNNSRDTLECLSSLQRSSGDLILVVVDNASSQLDIERIRARPEVVLLQNTENLGFGRGNNVGLKWAMENCDAKYLFIINNDATVNTDTIARLEAFLDNNSNIGGVVPKIVFAEEPDKIWYGGGEVDWKRGGGKVWGFRKHVEFDRSNITSRVNFASGCAIMFRREVLKHVGGFDPRYFMYEEDVDLSLRFAAVDRWITYIPDAIVYHKVQGTFRKGPFYSIISPRNPLLHFYVRHIISNRLLTMHKHARDMNRLKFHLYFPMYWSLKALQYVLSGRIDAVKAMALGYLEYRRLRNVPFTDEISGETRAM